jgi:hypothetical protein
MIMSADSPARLLARAAAALETPNDLTNEDRLALIDDLRAAEVLADAGAALPEPTAHQFTVTFSMISPSRALAEGELQSMLEHLLMECNDLSVMRDFTIFDMADALGA